MEKQQIIDYIMSTPTNTNWSVLSSMLGDGDWTRLKAYVETTPHNMNRMVLESFFSGSDEPDFLVVQFGVDFDMWDSDSPRVIEIFNYCLRHSIEQDGQIICKALKILNDDGTEVLPLGTVGILKEYSDAERYWDFQSGWITISESGDIGEYEEG